METVEELPEASQELKRVGNCLNPSIPMRVDAPLWLNLNILNLHVHHLGRVYVHANARDIDSDC